MIISVVVLGLVTAQRLTELVIARRNTARLKRRGGQEVGAGHYPLVVVLHAAWLVGLWVLAWNRPISLAWLGVFLVLQALRVWVLVTLGDRWTTRIIVLPGAPLVAKGPYRLMSHPNYAVVIAEIAVLPVAFGLSYFAALFSILNGVVLWIRIGAEGRALAASSASLKPISHRSA